MNWYSWAAAALVEKVWQHHAPGGRVDRLVEDLLRRRIGVVEVIKVQTAEGSVELDDEERFIFRAIVREIRQASYIFEEDPASIGFLELLSAVHAERKSADVRVEISADQMEWLGRLAYRPCEHLGVEEFSIRTGRTLQEAYELLDRLTSPAESMTEG